MKKNRQIIILLVILPVFGMVVPGSVYGEDTVYVQSTVTSSSHSGGYSTKGTDGVDGQNGEDGQSGQAGADVYSANNGAVVDLHSVTKDGETRTYIYSSTSGSGVVGYDVPSDTTNESLGSEETTTTQTDHEEIIPTAEQRSQLFSIINALQELIKHYVNVLF